MIKVHNKEPKDWNGLTTVGTFGKQDYQIAAAMEDRGIKEIWIYNLDEETRVVSYKKEQ